MELVKHVYRKARTQTNRIVRLHFFRFMLVGAAGFVLSTLLLRLLHGQWGLSILWATLLACEFGLLWNFIFHENWTYNSLDHHHKPLGQKLLQFHISSWGGVAILTGLEVVAVRLLHFEYLISFVVAGVVTMFWNFFWTRYVIFTPNNGERGRFLGAGFWNWYTAPFDARNVYVRCVLVTLMACGTSFVVLVLLAAILDIRFVVAASLSLLLGLACGTLFSVMLAFPDRTVRFLKSRTYPLLAALCCIVFVGLGTLSNYPASHVLTGNAITYDEIAFLPNGYFHQKEGVYYTNPEHPPLVKDVAALPFYALGAHMPAQKLPKDVLFQDYAQYYWGKVFLFESGNTAELLIFAGRLSVLVANAALLFLLFLSIARVWSGRAGFIAIFLITMSQFCLAHASVVTVDFMATVFTLLTLTWFAAWLKSFKDQAPDRAPLILTALCLSGALVSKFSTIVLVPMLAILTCLYILVVRKHLERHWLRLILRLILLLAIALGLVVVFYSFHIRNMPGQDIVTQLHKSYDTSRLPAAGLHVLESIATHFGILGRGFAEFVHGLLMINNRIYNGAGGVYFNGKWYGTEGAGLQYFPLLYITKLQLAYQALSIAALVGVVWLGWKTRFRGIMGAIARHPLAIVLAAYGLVFGGIASLSTLQIGLRHILPVIGACMMLTALGLDGLIDHLRKRKENRRWLGFTLGATAAWMVISMLISFPYYLSYYNLLAGGTNNGYKLAVDSNYDWGQDLKRLAKWQKENNVPMLYADIFTNPFLPIQRYLGPDSRGFAIHADPLPPPGSYIAVSINQYQINIHKDLAPNQQYTQLDRDLVARVGKTILVYRVP